MRWFRETRHPDVVDLSIYEGLSQRVGPPYTTGGSNEAESGIGVKIGKVEKKNRDEGI